MVGVYQSDMIITNGCNDYYKANRGNLKNRYLMKLNPIDGFKGGKASDLAK